MLLLSLLVCHGSSTLSKTSFFAFRLLDRRTSPSHSSKRSFQASTQTKKKRNGSICSTRISSLVVDIETCFASPHIPTPSFFFFFAVRLLNLGFSGSLAHRCCQSSLPRSSLVSLISLIFFRAVDEESSHRSVIAHPVSGGARFSFSTFFVFYFSLF